MKEIRLTVRCTENEDHAKILRIDADMGKQWAGWLAKLLDGTSPLYIHKPGERSPIGRCDLCHAPLKCDVQELDDGS